MPENLRAAEAQPRMILITSSGILKDSHDHLPRALRIAYPWLLAGPHIDKLGMERVLAHCAGWPWVDKAPRPEILPGDWARVPGTPAEGSLKHLLVIRPAMFSDGECKGDTVKGSGAKAPYRVAEGNLDGNNGWTISRKDVGHFIAEQALADWPQWEGKAVTIAY